MKILFVLDYSTFKEKWIEVANQVRPYADMIWFRIKNKDANEIYSHAKLLRKTLPDSRLILSDRADIAELAGFDGVHMGNRSISTEIIKQKYPNLTIGYSAHSINEIKSISADYYTLSPIFFTTKEYEVKPLGTIDVKNLYKDIYALGGISKNNILTIKDCGFKGIAGISFYKDIEKLQKIG